MESPAKASADNGAPARQSRACPPFLRGQHKISKKWAYRAGPAAIAAVVVLVTALALVEPASAAPRGQQQAAPVTATAALPAPAARQEPKAAPTALAYTPSHSWHRASIVLFGDSLTEMGTSNKGGWGQSMAMFYSRRADIINRGFGGYTSKQAVEMVPEIIETVNMKNTPLVTVWFGANDAVTLDGNQAFMSVSVEQYGANIRSIVAQLKAAGAANVLVITPPPVDDAKRLAFNPGTTIPDRAFKRVALYAAAAAAAGRDSGAFVLNMFQEMQETAPNGAWSDRYMLTDGLHFSEAGNDMVARRINEFIWTNIPAARNEGLPYHHPNWEEIHHQTSGPQFEAERAAAAAAAA